MTCIRVVSPHCHFFSSNIRSLPNKLDLLKAELTQLPEIVAIQETWTNVAHTDTSLAIPGYSIVRRDRVGRSRPHNSIARLDLFTHR